MFPPGPSRGDGTYRTVFGPSVSHTGQIYADNNHNTNIATRRLTGTRLPNEPGLHQTLFVNQAQFVHDHQPFLCHIASLYAPYFEEYKGAEIEALEHHADPHEKKELRIKAMIELQEEGIYVDTESLWLRKVWWKLKKNEWAKPGKKPRTIGDLGVAASLLGFRITNFLKTAQAAEVVEHNGGHFAFCKSPDPFELEKHFLNLYDPPGRFYFLYFSDDSCLAIRRPDGSVDRYNLDISSCDASHGNSIFDSLLKICPRGHVRDDMRRLVRQCAAPLKVYCDFDKDLQVHLKPKRPMLYSGSTITTGINNLANLLIGLAISELNYTGAVDAQGVSQEIVSAAARAGYILSGCSPLLHFEDVQFLKNSPVKDTNGHWKPLINFGVFLRASGTCNGDLPGRGPMRPRAEAFQRGLLSCTFPYTNSEVIDSLRATAGSGPIVVDRQLVDNFRYKVVANPAYAPYTVDTTSFCLRYRLCASEYSDLLNDFSIMNFGQHYHGDCVSKILEVDYGLKTTEHDGTNYLATSYATPFSEVVL